MKPFYHDLRRALLSKTVIALAALMILASFTVVPLMAQAVGPRGGILPYFVAYEHDAGGYHFLTYTTDQYGRPMPVNTMISLTTEPRGGSAYTVLMKANSSGLAYGTIVAPNGSYYLGIRSGFWGQEGSGVSNADGVVHNDFPWYYVVSDPGNSSQGRLLVFWAGDGLSPPVGYGVYYKVAAGTLMEPLSPDGAKLLGTLQGYAAVFPVPPDFSLTGDYAMTVYLYSPNGSLVWQSQPLGNGAFTGQGASYLTESGTAYLFTGMFATLVPLLSILGAYNVYGKDRASGILKSILARPISRAGLLTSRYLAIVCALSLAVTMTVLVADFLVYSTVGVAFSLYYIVGTIASMAVEVCAFVGISFLLAHLLKGSGSLMMASMAVFLALVLFWGFAVNLIIEPIPGLPMDASTVWLQILSDMVNPGQFMSLTSTFMLGTVKTLLGQAFGGLQMPVASYGLTIWSLAADGLVWVALPIWVALRLAKGRD